MALSRDITKEPFWSLPEQEVFHLLETTIGGLSEEEALKRLSVFKENTIRERHRSSWIGILAHQFRSPLIIILIAAGGINIFLREWIETGVIFAAVFINTILGFWQENKAETVLELLKSYVRTRARVRRGGNEREIDASQLVPGDVVRIVQGDRIPADARLVFVNNFEVDEAVLTGESMPVEKNRDTSLPATPLSDRLSMVFGGTLVMQGFADAVITATGNDTEFGKITALIGEKEELTPLQRSVHDFAAYTGGILVVITLLLFVIGIYSGQSLYDMFLVTVAVAVSAVPEGLPIALTVILAIGVQRLAYRKGIVRRLLAAETLGSTSLILTDKTGTLTQAKMKLTTVVSLDGTSQEPTAELLRFALLNADIVIENPHAMPSEWVMSGRALETSLVRGAIEHGVLLPDIQKRYEVIDRLPFNSQHKFSVTIARASSELILTLFGAPEIILQYTDLDQEKKKDLASQIEKMAFAGERVLGVASRSLIAYDKSLLKTKSFSGLTFKGLIGFRDPLRPGVANAVREIAAAGISTIIVTGDHPGTAEAVARELGIIDGKGALMTGDDMRHLAAEELLARAQHVSVYARVTPEQKVIITKLYQQRGEVVAVTGDGVNDAPALHAADVGVAVGSGTDVAKSAADLVILDDNFETIVAAIKEGRRVLQNIRKVIVFLLSNIFSELFLIGGALLFGIALPINALQILFVNLFSDSFPAIAFAFEKGIDGLKSRSEGVRRNIFDQEMKFFILGIGSLSSLLLFVLYGVLLAAGFPLKLVQTFMFASFASYTLFLAFSLRSLEKSILQYNPFSNKVLSMSVVFGFVLIAGAVYLPWFQRILGTMSLPLLWIGGVVLVGLVNIIMIEIGKYLFARMRRQE